jgi:hypothetical protein
MWVKKDNWHMKNGEWTIAKAINVPMPYALYEGNKEHGYFKTVDEAKAKHMELTK